MSELRPALRLSRTYSAVKNALVDRKGKLRAGWLQRLEGLVNVAKGLDAMLGLERRQKRVPSLQEVMSE
jgi:membrane-bound lytic murein transglycosylase MltF